MAELLLAICAVTLLAGLVRLGKLAREVEAIRRAQEPPPASEQVGEQSTINTNPMSEIRGPRTLDEMRRYFHGATASHQWETPDPKVAEQFERAAAKRERQG